MLCPNCNGSGKLSIAVAENPFTGAGGFFPKCKKCNGTGKIEKTNDYWRKTCSAEEFADFISAVLDYGFGIDYAPRNPMGENVNDKEDIIEWLRKNHKENK